MESEYTFNKDTLVHETEFYQIDVGSYPSEELLCYRVHNKKTKVIEYAHCIHFYATQWADMATNILNGESLGSPLMDLGLESLTNPGVPN